MHLALSYIAAWLSDGNYDGYYGILGGIVFYFVFGYWVYFILSAFYIKMAGKDTVKKVRYLKGLIVVTIGYFFSRIPDIIDDHFLRDFAWKAVAAFLLLIPILVEVEFWLRKRMDKRA